jgi:hypothetical protein
MSLGPAVETCDASPGRQLGGGKQLSMQTADPRDHVQHLCWRRAPVQMMPFNPPSHHVSPGKAHSGAISRLSTDYHAVLF